jgi:hypothetical protein
MFNKLRRKILKRKNYKQAIKLASEQVWWVYYKTSNGEEQVINVTADSARNAKITANDILKWKLDCEFEITNICCI